MRTILLTIYFIFSFHPIAVVLPLMIKTQSIVFRDPYKMIFMQTAKLKKQTSCHKTNYLYEISELERFCHKTNYLKILPENHLHGRNSKYRTKKVLPSEENFSCFHLNFHSNQTCRMQNERIFMLCGAS